MTNNRSEDRVLQYRDDQYTSQVDRIRDVYGLVPADELENTQKKLDPETLRNMERCADFVARMLIKYGRKVLQRIENEENDEESHNMCDIK